METIETLPGEVEPNVDVPKSEEVDNTFEDDAEEEHSGEEEEEDDVNIIINTGGKFGSLSYNKSALQKTIKPTTETTLPVVTGKPLAPALDIPDDESHVEDLGFVEESPEEDKPWKKPGADITDYFNYGYTEESWVEYSKRQESIRRQYGDSLNRAVVPCPLSQLNKTRVSFRPSHTGSINVIGSNDYAPKHTERITTIGTVPTLETRQTTPYVPAQNVFNQPPPGYSIPPPQAMPPNSFSMPPPVGTPYMMPPQFQPPNMMGMPGPPMNPPPGWTMPPGMMPPQVMGGEPGGSMDKMLDQWERNSDNSNSDQESRRSSRQRSRSPGRERHRSSRRSKDTERESSSRHRRHRHIDEDGVPREKSRRSRRRVTSGSSEDSPRR